MKRYIKTATNTCNISGKPVFGDSISDEKVYRVSGYTGSNFRGLSDSKDFADYEESLDYAFDQVSIGAYVIWEDLVSGKKRYFSPDQMSQSYEDYGDISSINDAEIFR